MRHATNGGGKRGPNCMYRNLGQWGDLCGARKTVPQVWGTPFQGKLEEIRRTTRPLLQRKGSLEGAARVGVFYMNVHIKLITRILFSWPVPLGSRPKEVGPPHSHVSSRRTNFRATFTLVLHLSGRPVRKKSREAFCPESILLLAS